MEKRKNNSPGTFQINFENHKLDVEVASDNESRKKGLSKRKIKDNTAMLFVFPKAGKHQMWMKDTESDLDMVFMNENGQVVDVQTGQAGDEELIGDRDDIKYVLEMPAGLSIRHDIVPGDELDIPEEFHGAMDDEDPSMILLDDEGNPQMNLKGGERIFSRKKTKEIVDGSYSAKSMRELIKLGKIVADEVLAQDSRDPEFVTDQPENVVYAKNGTKLKKLTVFPELGDMDITDVRNVLSKYGYHVVSL